MGASKRPGGCWECVGMFEGIFGTRRELDRTRAETQFSAVVEVEAYWQALRENHHVPKRSDLDPRGIRETLF